MTKSELRQVITALEYKNKQLRNKLDRLKTQIDYDKWKEEGKDKGQLFSMDLEPMCNIVKEAEYDSKTRRKETIIRVASVFTISLCAVLTVYAIAGWL